MIGSSSHLTYGQALYKVASVSEVAPQVLEDLRSLVTLMDDAQSKELLKNVGSLEKMPAQKLLKNVFEGKIQKVTLHLLMLLAQAQKLLLLPRIYEVYKALHYEAQKIADVKVITARTLSHEEQKSIVQLLEQQLKKTVSADFVEDKKLIGGVQVFEKGYVMDHSVRHYLDFLKNSLLETHLSKPSHSKNSDRGQQMSLEM